MFQRMRFWRKDTSEQDCKLIQRRIVECEVKLKQIAARQALLHQERENIKKHIATYGPSAAANARISAWKTTSNQVVNEQKLLLMELNDNTAWVNKYKEQTYKQQQAKTALSYTKNMGNPNHSKSILNDAKAIAVGTERIVENYQSMSMVMEEVHRLRDEPLSDNENLESTSPVIDVQHDVVDDEFAGAHAAFIDKQLTIELKPEDQIRMLMKRNHEIRMEYVVKQAQRRSTSDMISEKKSVE